MTQWQLDHAKAEDWLPTIEAASVDLVLVDPPYYKVKDEPWDRQWDTAAGFLAWLDGLAAEWQRILKPNGSLYVFASPQMAARVEVLIGQRFNVLTNIRWRKPPYSTKAEMFRKEDMRSFFPASETIIFAEQQDADLAALGESEYARRCGELRVEVFRPIGQYIQQERERTGLTRKQLAAHFPSRSGGLTGCVTNWEEGYNFPTVTAYTKLRDVLNATGIECLQRDHRDLRREYEALDQVYLQRRQSLDHLKERYEQLRRPFAASDQTPYTDVWDFKTVQQYPGKHVCEKPLPLLRHIIGSSTRPGALVLDCFAGSGNTGIAARQLGRRFIGCDYSATWATRGARRIADAALQQTLALPA